MHQHVRRPAVTLYSRRGKAAALSALILFLLPLTTWAQASINPDISVIPRFRVETNDGEKLDQGRREFSPPDFMFEELEIALQAYLNPFAKADVVLTLPGPDLEQSKLGIEEVYATILRGLPLDLNLKFGKYRAEFGKLNTMHPHAWPFITQPLMAETFLGEEGLNDLGVSVSTLLPTGGVYTRLSLDLLRGSAIGDGTGIPDTTGARPTYAIAGRLSGFFPLDDERDLEVGLSGYTGIHDPYNRDRFWYGNLDFKYKYRPSAYTSLVVQGEVLYNTRRALQDRDGAPFLNALLEPEAKTISTAGMYVYMDYQFLKLYSAGARYDWSQSPYSTDKARAVSIFFGYYPVEETLGARLEYQHSITDTPFDSRSVNTLALQVLFSLGPHKAHPF
jgi:hypothetical protein